MPFLCFGGGTVGEGAFSTTEGVSTLLDTLAACKINRIDTAAVYPASAPGASERLFGTAKAAERGLIIDTKIEVSGAGPGQGSLKKGAIDKSVTKSMATLNVDEINVLYCHIPDTATSVEETAAALHDHWSKGHFKKLGLCNYSVDQVQEFLSVCDRNGWVKPTTYQGQYNAICRKMEGDLLPLLRRHGMTYVAFSPLAGGFLTGNFSLGNDLAGTRFEEGNLMGAHYKPMYDKSTMHSAIRELHAFLEPRSISVAEASLRWIFHHSALGKQDGVILGATKVAQIERNVGYVNNGPLAEEELSMLEETWEKVRAIAP